MFTVTIAHLNRHISNVSHFVAPKAAYVPLLECLQFDVTPQRLIVRATDRYAIGETYSPVIDGDETYTACLHVDDLKQVTALLKAIPRKEHDTARVLITRENSQITFATRVSSVTLTINADTPNYPPLSRLYPDFLPDAVPDVSYMALSALNLARLGKIRDPYTPSKAFTPVSLHPQKSPTKPIVALSGDWFKGLIVPLMRYTAPTTYPF